MLPDFFVIGAQKAGSTYLLECLGEHPEVFMPPSEVAFFEDPLYASERLDEFERNFDAARDGQVVGVKRPNVLARPECPERLAAHMPDLRLIVVLREPIERAISAYFHYMKTGLLPIVPMEQGLPMILEGSTRGYPRAGEVLTFGKYAESLERFDKFYPSTQIHVTLLDDIKRDAAHELARLYAFLGVDPGYQPRAISRRPMGAPYSLTRLRLWNALDRFGRASTHGGMNFNRRKGLLATPVVGLNQLLDRCLWKRLFPARRPKPSPALQSLLVEYYRGDVLRLQERLGRGLPEWKSFSA